MCPGSYKINSNTVRTILSIVIIQVCGAAWICPDCRHGRKEVKKCGGDFEKKEIEQAMKIWKQRQQAVDDKVNCLEMNGRKNKIAIFRILVSRGVGR
jgi:glutaredoxin-related protein